MPKFSVITPVHLWSPERVEMFVKCIDSLAKQTYKDFEWIVIDDGSTIKDFYWDRRKLIGTKVKIIRFLEGDHNIDCKIDGIGAMQLKSEFVKKT